MTRNAAKYQAYRNPSKIKMENAEGLKITDDYVHGPLETSFWSKTSTENRINARVTVVVEFTS